MTQDEFNELLQIAIAQGIGGGTYISRYSGEEIDALLGLTGYAAGSEVIANLMTGVAVAQANAEQAADKAEESADRAAEDAETAATAAQVSAHPPRINYSTGYWQTWDTTINDYKDTPDVALGKDGKGIVSNKLTKTEGNVDYWTITYTDGSTSTYTVTNSPDATAIYNAYPHAATGPSDIITVDDGADNIPVRDLVVSLEPVQAGEGDPSPDNVRPITGHSEVGVTRAGKNLLDADTKWSDAKQSDGSYRGSVWYFYDVARRFSVPKHLVGKTLCFSAYLNVPSGATICHAYVLDGAGKAVSGNDVISGTSGRSSVVFTPTSEDWVFYISTGNGGGTMTISHPQLELGSTATDYEPYQGTTLSINLQDTSGQPGTVYGGTLDVTTGVLTVDREYVVFNKDSSWVLTHNSHFRDVSHNFDFAPTNAVGRETITNFFVYAYNSNSIPSFYFTTGSSTSQSYIIFSYDAVATTVSQWVDWLSDGDKQIQVVAKLTTPLTYQLTPQELTTLLGENTVWSDSGQITLDYRRDPTLALDKLENAILALGGNV